MNEPITDDARLAEVESALRGLRPAASAIDREALMYRAGRASARRGLRLWQGATALLAVVIVVGLVTLRAPDAAQRDAPMLAEYEHQRFGRVRSVGMPMDVYGYQADYRAGPGLGADGPTLLGELGYDDEEQALLRERGAFGAPVA